MFSRNFSKGLAIVAATAMFSMSTLQSAYARPGILATAPLFLSSIVEPNVFLTHDDSGSMGWEQMVQTGTGGFTSSSGLPLVGATYRYYYHPTPWNDKFVLPPETLFPNVWIFRNHNGNKNYYNPTVDYKPWPGTKADGSPMYVEYPIDDAPYDPNDPGSSGSGDRTDLTTTYNFYDYDFCNCWIVSALYLPTYYTWIDTDADGLIEPTDANVRVTITDADELQNFSNWFTYYRSREFSAKAAIGGVINNTDASRMGLDVFNDGPQEDVRPMSVAANKRTLLETFYDVDSSGGTPARAALKRVGELFKTSPGSSNAPILDKAGGGECQQNFNILLSDGFWNGSTPSGIGNADASPGSNDTIYDGDETQSNDGRNYADSHSTTLADIAMYYYEQDLINDSILADKVPIQTDIDENNQQHLVTYTIAFGLTGTLDPLLDDPEASGFVWPNAYAGDPQKVDDMWHAAYNGRGKYLSAQNPQELEQSLNEAIADIAERTATAAAVSVNSTQLNTDTVVYLAEFNNNRWQGDMKAYKIKTDANGNLDPTGELNPNYEWSAAEKLDARTADRVMLTYNGTKGIPFQWDTAAMSQLQLDDLRTSPTGVLQSNTEGQQRVDYMRGDRTLEGSTLRKRLTLLGDLVNSGPVYVGKPGLNWPDKAPFPTTSGQRYSDFKNGPKLNRPGVVYAAANDSMLHGFAEADGEEVVAYIPGNLFSTASKEGIHYLTDPGYGHQYYNDLTPTVSDIYADLGGGQKWQTVLINGQRGGGRGIYALNVDDPASFTETNAENLVLWEFSSADDDDLGHTFSRPQIAFTNDDRWVAIFGNGYNDTGVDGQAKLFILDIAGGSDGDWDNADVIEIPTGVGTAADRNGLATPRLADIDGNGTVDRVYAADLFGNLWVFDLSGNGAGAWKSAGATKLFTTKNGESITTTPILALHPTVSSDGSNDPNIMVYFGSGQYLTKADRSDLTTVNHFYGFWDKSDDDLTPYPLSVGAGSNLVQQTYENGFTDGNGDPVRVLTNNPVNYLGGDFGWYFELDEPGEKMIFDPVLRAGIVFFTTFIPNTDPCSEGGDNYFFGVDMITGGSPSEPQIDTNGDGVINDQDRVSNGATTGVMAARRSEGLAPNPVFVDDIAYTGAKPTKVKKLKDIPTGRFSWQELLK